MNNLSTSPTKESVERFKKNINFSKPHPAKTRLLSHFEVGNLCFSSKGFILICPSQEFYSPDGDNSDEKKKEIYDNRHEIRTKISADLRTIGFRYLELVSAYVKFYGGK